MLVTYSIQLVSSVIVADRAGKGGHGTQVKPVSHLRDLCLCYRERNTDHLPKPRGNLVAAYLCHHVDVTYLERK